MTFENLMRTTDYLDRLDPLRPSLRRTAQVRFDRGQFAEFLEDLEDHPQWRFSPTALFLAAKAHVQLGQLSDADTRCEGAWRIWQEIFDEEGEARPEQPDADRLDISFDVLRAQIRRFEGDLEGAEARLSRVEALVNRRRIRDPEGFADVETCLIGERRALEDAKRGAEADSGRDFEIQPARRQEEPNHNVAADAY